MKRHHLAAVTALVLAATATHADDAAAQAAPVAAAAPPPSAAPVAQPIRVHVRTYRNKGTARLYIHRSDGSYTLVCASPCTADVPGNSELRVTLANNDDDPHTFVLPADLGSEVDLEVRPAPIGALVGSIVTMGAGGVFVLSGLLFIALSDFRYSSNASTSSTQRDVSTSYKTTGYVMIGLGAAAAVAGFVWFLSRSHEPQVFDSPYQQPQVYGRRETLLGDVALAKPRDPTSTITDAPPPFTPLQYGFSF